METFKKIITIFTFIFLMTSFITPVQVARAVILPGPSAIRSGTATQTQGTGTINTNGSVAIQPGQATQTVVKTSLCSSLSINTVNEVISMIICTITGFLVPAFITLAIVSFMWGVIQTILNPTNEEARKKAKSFIMWGLIGLLVITSIWGIVKIFTSTFGIDTFLPPLSQ